MKSRILKSQIVLLSLLGMNGLPSFAQSTEKVAPTIDPTSIDATVRKSLAVDVLANPVADSGVQNPATTTRPAAVITNQPLRHSHRIGLPGLFHINLP